MKLRDVSSGSFKQPYDDAPLAGLVARAMYRATGSLFDDPKKTAPHDFRRITITWQRKYGDGPLGRSLTIARQRPRNGGRWRRNCRVMGPGVGEGRDFQNRLILEMWEMGYSH